MTILIPAYEPTWKLIQLIDELIVTTNFKIVVVDDGSGYKYKNIFLNAKERGCTVLLHVSNLGKGEALKTGFTFIQQTNEKEGVVSVDCDGQHLPKDIISVAKSVIDHPNKIVLGCRNFVGKVPMKSLVGNTLTKYFFRLLSGITISDTQTGLRGFSLEIMDWLCQVNGSRFEYEMNMLLEASRDGLELFPIEIETVYYNQNKSSHFRPIIDAARIYLPLFKFSLSSILSGILDFVLVMVLHTMTAHLFTTVVVARIVSSCFNYTINKLIVFSDSKKVANHSLVKYFALVVAILLLNYEILHLLNEILHVPIYLAKILTEICVFSLSYYCQHQFVFHSKVTRS